MTETKTKLSKKRLLVILCVALLFFVPIALLHQYLAPEGPLLTIEPLNVTDLEFQLVDKFTGRVYSPVNVSIYIDGDATRNMSISEMKWGSEVAVIIEADGCYSVGLLINADSPSLTYRYSYFSTAGTAHERTDLGQLNNQASFDGSIINLGTIPTYEITRPSEEMIG